MRPRRSTPVASTTTSEAPEFASMPRWVTCQSVGMPSLALYWHIGATTMRLASSRPLILYGENSALMGLSEWEGMQAGDVGEQWRPDGVKSTAPPPAPGSAH